VSTARASGGRSRSARARSCGEGSRTKAADIGSSTVQALEKVDGVPTIKGGGVEPTLEHREAVRDEAIGRAVRALEKAGIKFLSADAHGPEIRGKR
jgi:hypothetical protein